MLANEVEQMWCEDKATTEREIEKSDYWTALSDAKNWVKRTSYMSEERTAFTTMKDAIKVNKFEGWTENWVREQLKIDWGEAAYDKVFTVLDPKILS